MLYFKDSKLIESEYILSKEAQIASLMTTGNGYLGCRGSLEEFGATKIQGLFVRGLIDEIVEIVEPFSDNIYMKKYYFDEEKLKKFEKQDSCINISDFLLVRFIIGDKTFYPWEGKILSWERYIDLEKAIMYRNVLWSDDEGNITKFVFERFASYSNEHIYCIKATAIPQNHNLPVSILSGLDNNVRTNGQIISKKISEEFFGNNISYSLKLGNKYNFEVGIGIKNKFYSNDGIIEVKNLNGDGIIANQAIFAKSKSYTVEKICFIYTSRDNKNYNDYIKDFNMKMAVYTEEKQAHIKQWENTFSKMDIKIKGDDISDSALRFANYHTLISAALSDNIHSLSAKGLTGEKYNQFVWWDCEIYQLPIFTHTMPEVTKSALEYRYRMLNGARELAREQGLNKGARYPFVSSVDGKEHVWIYARHPFLQIHIMADIAYAIIYFFENTNDAAFIEEKGLEMLLELSRYWMQKVTKTVKGYEILNVTGTDEHHPYVNNDAYTNYLVQYILEKTQKIIELLNNDAVKKVLDKINFTEEEKHYLKDVSQKLYLPLNECRLIPQFDGYFDLNRDLEIEGTGTGTNFQMKKSGLYHKSQIIKQPDVMLLYSYINRDMDNTNFDLNWDYYEDMCESSSSLTYPVHAVCSALAGRMNSFLNYFNDTVHIDVWDKSCSAHQGVHSGCLAGAWYSIFKGVLGITVKNKVIYIKPNIMPFWEEISLYFLFLNQKLKVTMNKTELLLENTSSNNIVISIIKDEKEYFLKDKLKFML